MSCLRMSRDSPLRNVLERPTKSFSNPRIVPERILKRTVLARPNQNCNQMVHNNIPKLKALKKENIHTHEKKK